MLAEAGGVRLAFVNLPCILQGLRRLRFLGRRGSTVVHFRFSLGDPLFGVGGFAMQKATSGAKVTLMVVPNVMHSQ